MGRRVYSGRDEAPHQFRAVPSQMENAIGCPFGSSFLQQRERSGATEMSGAVTSRQVGPAKRKAAKRKAGSSEEVSASCPGFQQVETSRRFSYIVKPSCAGKSMWLCLQSEFCIKNGLVSNTLVDLTVDGLEGKKWVAEFVFQDQNNVKRRALMYAGFRAFVRDNQLQAGDELIIELMQVTPRPWFQVSIIRRDASPDVIIIRKGASLQHDEITNPSWFDGRNPYRVVSLKVTWSMMDKVLIDTQLQYYYDD